MAKLPKTEMRAHIFELCSDNYIDIHWIKPYQKAEALFDERIIHVYPVKSTISYITCLHEIGHLVDYRSRTTSDVLTSEACAWRWAQREALFWNVTARNHADMCLRSYMKLEGKPEDDHVFWEVYKK